MNKSCIAALSIAGLLISSVSARTWTSADGANTLEGEFKSFDASTGKITLTQSNGQQKSFSLQHLSEADQEWVKTQPVASEKELASVDITQQEVGKKLTSRVLHRLSGKRFKRASIEKAPEYYILYFSASW